MLGHEGVGIVEGVIDTRSKAEVAGHDMVGARVVVEINCPCADTGDDTSTSAPIKRALEDPVYFRNHFPRRTVLGIIARDGLLAERALVPLDNCIVVPDGLTDTEAAFAEPLAAAYRIVEQEICCGSDRNQQNQRVAVIGDGKLGLLIAHVLVTKASPATEVWHFGRHERKLAMVDTHRRVLGDDIPEGAMGSFDVAIEASGSPAGVERAIELLRPMGTLVLKTTCSLDADPASLPNWSAMANDIVVNEKRVVGSRCGPQKKALELLAADAGTRTLVNGMVDRVYEGLDEAIAALDHASRRGSLKVMVRVAARDE